MESRESDGQRLLLTWQPSFWFREIAKLLAKEFRSQGNSATFSVNCFSLMLLQMFRLLAALLPGPLLCCVVLLLLGCRGQPSAGSTQSPSELQQHQGGELRWRRKNKATNTWFQARAV